MNEMVFNTSAFPEPLYRLIRSEKVKVNENNGVFSLIPILDIKDDCPLLGIAADSNLTVEKLLAMTREDEEIERE